MKLTIPHPSLPQETLTVAVICDACQVRFEGINWGIEALGHFATTRLSYTHGVRHSDGSGMATDLAVDLCPTCFTAKLLPWLRAEGVILQEWATVYPPAS